MLLWPAYDVLIIAGQIRDRMLSATESEGEYFRLRYRRRAVYFALALAYGLQRILQPCMLRLLSSLLANPGVSFGPLSNSRCL